MRLDRDNPPNQIPLPGDAAELWPFLVDEIEERGFSERVPPHRLAIYCQLFAQYLRVTKAINEEGQIETLTNKFGEFKEISANAVQQAKLVAILKTFDKEFGFLEERIDLYEELRRKLDSRLAAPPGKN